VIVPGVVGKRVTSRNTTFMLEMGEFASCTTTLLILNSSRGKLFLQLKECKQDDMPSAQNW